MLVSTKSLRIRNVDIVLDLGRFSHPPILGGVPHPGRIAESNVIPFLV